MFMHALIKDTYNNSINSANTVYGNTTSTVEQIKSAKLDLSQAKTTFESSVNQYFTGLGNWNETSKWSAGFLPATTSSVTVQSGQLSVNQNVTGFNS